MPALTIGSDQIWLKGTGAASQVWSFTVSGLPAGAIINSAVLGFATGNTYATPGSTAVYWGSSTSGTKLWAVSGSGGGTAYSVSLKSYITGNGSYSLLFYKSANASASQSNVYFTSLAITIDYTNPVSSFSLNTTSLSVGETLTVTISRADSSYTHTVKYALGDKSYTATGVATSSSYTIPYAWVDQITDGVSRTATVTVTTLNASGGTVGAVSQNVTVKWVNTKSDFTLSATSLKAGEMLTVSISRKVDGYTHTVKYALGSRSNTVTGATTSSSFTFPLSWVDQITDGVSRTATVTVETLKSDGTSLGTTTKNLTVKWVDTKSSFTLSATSLDAGSALSVTITKKVSSYTHQVVFAFGSRRYTVTGVDTSTSYTIPTSWLDQIPSATSGTGAVEVTTINASGGTVGASTQNVTIKAGSGVVPTLGTVTAAPVNGLDGRYIQGYSRCNVSVYGHGAGTGATVASVLITGNGDSVWATSLTSSLLQTAGTVTFTVKVTDSRGRSVSGNVSITVVAYKPVSITGKTALRCKSDGTVSRVTGKSAKLGVSYTITSVGSNAGTVSVYWRVYGADSWTKISGWSSTSGYTAVALTDALALDSRYEIRFDVADKVTTASQTAVIEPGAVYMVWSKVKSSFGLGTYPTAEKQVAIAEDWSLMLGSMNVGNAVWKRTRVMNLLDNSDFTNPVNSLYIITMSASGDAIDRWRFQISSDGGASLSTQYGDVRFCATSGYADFKQFQKNPDSLMGKEMTFAANITNLGTLILNFTYGTSKMMASSGGEINLIHWDANQVIIRTNTSTWLAINWAALYEGTYTAETLPTYHPKGIMVEMLNCGVPLQPRNWLDNGSLVKNDLVNQRGSTSYTASGMTVDRWRSIGAVTVEVHTVGLTVATTGKNQWGQYLSDEAWNRLKGKAWTFAIGDSNGNVYLATGVLTSGTELYDSPQISVGTTGFKMNIYKDANQRPMARIFAAGVDSSIIIRWAALYEGKYTVETLPEYVPKGYAAELAECQRYYENSWFGSGKGVRVEYLAACWSDSQADGIIPYKVHKRVVPTVTFYPTGDLTAWQVFNDSVFSYASAIAVINRNGVDALKFRINKGSADTTTWVKGSVIQCNGQWQASAEP